MAKYERLSFDAYRKLPGTNWTRLKSMRVSALQFKYDEGHEIDETPALRIGSAAHAYVLEPDELARRFVVYDGKVRNGKYWDEFRLEHAGQVILNQREWDLAEGAGKAVLANPLAKAILREGLHELAVQWKDEKTGLELRGRTDHIGGRKVVELKTTAVMDPRRWSNLFASNAYHGQLSYYSDGLRANGIDVDDEPFVIVVQNEPPHDVIVQRVKPSVISAGDALVRELLGKLKHHRETDTWPGLGADQIVDLDIPAWAYGLDAPLNLTMGGAPLGFDPTENW